MKSFGENANSLFTFQSRTQWIVLKYTEWKHCISTWLELIVADEVSHYFLHYLLNWKLLWLCWNPVNDRLINCVSTVKMCISHASWWHLNPGLASHTWQQTRVHRFISDGESTDVFGTNDQTANTRWSAPRFSNERTNEDKHLRFDLGL